MRFKSLGLILTAFSLSACEEFGSPEPNMTAVIMLAHSSGVELDPRNMENFRCFKAGGEVWQCDFLEVVPARGPYPEMRRQRSVRLRKASSGWVYAR